MTSSFYPCYQNILEVESKENFAGLHVALPDNGDVDDEPWRLEILQGHVLGKKGYRR